MTDPVLQIPEVIQTASINRNPSPDHDVNPPTAASEKQPVVDDAPSEAGSIPSDIVDPRHMVRPATRRHNFPPLPDLRFEQSYLASLRGADTWGRVAWITIRDQVSNLSLPASQFPDRQEAFSRGMFFRQNQVGNLPLTSSIFPFSQQVLLPLMQGTLWTLALSGWRFWNRNASLSGQTLGSRIRRWWYEVNNWKLPPLGSARDPRVAAKVDDFYTAQFSNAV
ncbi:DUF1770 domain-containing protein [Aspergillus aculeatinus CBS 121060]|uniref:DUF1770-domain-containing protein n=1 Tax=Aspergillus aculeatinus CBS 121060 TaxID=1448322 RepID=A0ACD1GSU1_9EURO|nr:DUF1770-domain-containing protein [Aspergillus aculeatinus CBS 121060]RAH64420.1 DUF1770-domain-containing protein [Aspergillus aculeatinus CBS 121060]